MHRTATSMCHQQNRLQAYRENCDSYRYFNLLTSEALLEKVEGLLPEHRERLYPPTETLSMFLAQTVSADRSCQNIVNQAAVQRLVGGLNPGSTYTGGYCRARQRIPLEMVDGLTQRSKGLREGLRGRYPFHYNFQLSIQFNMGPKLFTKAGVISGKTFLFWGASGNKYLL